MPTATEWSPPSTSGNLLLAERAIHHDGQALARERDLRQILGAVGALGEAFGLVHGHVAEIVGVVAEGRQALIQIGDADGGGAHVHAAAVLAEVERRSDDGDVGMLHEVVWRGAMDEFIAMRPGSRRW